MSTDTVFAGGPGKWDFVCPWDDVRSGMCGYVSRGWESVEAAADRGREHLYEHMEGVPMSDMRAFMARHGLRDNHHAIWD